VGSPPDVSVVTSGHDVADARLHRLVAAFRRRGLSVEVLGLGDPADGPEGARVTTRARGRVWARPLTAVVSAARARGRVVVALDPDALVAVTVLGRLRRRAVVADVHEDYGALLRDRAWATGLTGALAGVLVAVAGRAARAGDLVLVADEHVPPRAAPHRLVVRNLPDPSMLPAPTEPAERPRALYVGDVRASRGLWSMLDAVAAAPGWTLDVVGPVAAADAGALAARLERDDLAGRVRLHGRRPPAEAWRRARGAWCGLVLLEDTPAFRDAVPSKLYEYLACGLPVVVTDLPRQAAIVREGGVGEVVPCGPAAGAATARVLTAWSADPGRHREVAATVRARQQAHDQADPYAAAADAVADLARRG
jgi:glycosyltransferase involved in cell wall biosynthesis